MIKIEAQYIGLLTGLLMVAGSLLSFYVLKVPIESNFQLLIYSIFTAGIIWSLFNYFKSSTVNIAFKDYFSVGFKTFVISTLLMALFTFVFFSYNTAFRDEKIAANSKLLLEEGNHLPQEIEENAKQLKKIFMLMMISSAMFRYLIIGAIATAAGAAFFSQKSKEAANGKVSNLKR